MLRIAEFSNGDSREAAAAAGAHSKTVDIKPRHEPMSVCQFCACIGAEGSLREEKSVSALSSSAPLIGGARTIIQ